MLAKGFPEIEELSRGCPVTDCAHADEPGCAVLAAVADASLTQRRLESWRALAREERWIPAGGGPRALSRGRRRCGTVSRPVCGDGLVSP